MQSFLNDVILILHQSPPNATTSPSVTKLSIQEVVPLAQLLQLVLDYVLLCVVPSFDEIAGTLKTLFRPYFSSTLKVDFSSGCEECSLFCHQQHLGQLKIQYSESLWYTHSFPHLTR